MPSRGPVRRTVRSSVGYCVTAQYGKAATRAGAALPLCVTGGVCRPQRLVRMLQQQGAQLGDCPCDLPGPRRTTGSLRRWLTVAERAARGSSRRSARPPPHDGLSSQGLTAAGRAARGSSRRSARPPPRRAPRGCRSLTARRSRRCPRPRPLRCHSGGRRSSPRPSDPPRPARRARGGRRRASPCACRPSWRRR